MTESSSSQKRPGKKPDNSKRIPKDVDLPPSMVKELREGGVFRLLGISNKIVSGDDTVSRIDLAARRYLYIYRGGRLGYSLAEEQREIAESIGRRAARLSRAIVKDPEVSKRFFLALRKSGDERFVGPILKAGEKLQDKEQFLQGLLQDFMVAARLAKGRSRSTKRRPGEHEAEVDLAKWIFDENPSFFEKSYSRRKDDGRITIRKSDRELLEKLIARILLTVLMIEPLVDPEDGRKIEPDDVYSVASAAVSSLNEDYKNTSHEHTDDDEASENEIPKKRWYPNKVKRG